MNYKNMGSSSDGKDLARQLSVYSLTFDELQSTMGGLGVGGQGGKDFGSMNMDEFLKNIWTAEESQAMASASVAAGGGGGGLQRQGSLVLPRTLSQKTVDEVWRDLAGGQQPTLGEMTLEEFLVRAGVAREEINQPSNSTGADNVFYSELPVSNSNQGVTLGFADPGRNNGNFPATNLAMTRAYPAPLPLGNAADLGSPRMRGGVMVGIGDPALNNGLMPGAVGIGGGRVTVSAVASPVKQIPSDGLAKSSGDLSSLSPAPYVFGGGLRTKKSGGAVEKVVERRQKRMIKNRESAARSRARKQAYTMELEGEISKLKELNEDLQKKQVEIKEMQKNQAESALVAEAQAVAEGLKMALTLNRQVKRVWVATDCKIPVDLLQNGGAGSTWSAYAAVMQCCHMFSSFSYWTENHILRSNNTNAHNLSLLSLLRKLLSVQSFDCL